MPAERAENQLRHSLPLSSFSNCFTALRDDGALTDDGSL